MKPLLEAVGLTKKYGGVIALSDFSLTIDMQEIHGLVGENGAGKSTFVKIITGVIKPDAGHIVIDGHRYSFLTPLQAITNGIQVVHQDLSLFPNLTVGENICLLEYFIRSVSTVKWRLIMEKAQQILTELGTDIAPNIEVGLLSVGDRQIVAIGRALASRARILVLDEPTSALSHREVLRLFSILSRLRDSGISILIISHKLDEILSITDRITVIRDGKKVGTYETSALTKEELEFLMTGRRLGPLIRKESKTKGRVLLKVEKLSRPGEFEDVSFELHEGEVLGLIGPLGSGRTELALSIIGVNPPKSGKIFIGGKEVKCRSPAHAMRHGIVYCPEDRLSAGVFLPYSVMTNLAAANLISFVNKARLLSVRKMNAFALDMVANFSIKVRTVKDPVWSLSGGNQQKVLLAKFLAKRPKIIIVDKPTFGIDVGTKAAIHQLLRELADNGAGILFISDEAGELLRCADRILIMRHGKIIAEVFPSETTERDINTVVYGETDIEKLQNHKRMDIIAHDELC